MKSGLYTNPVPSYSSNIKAHSLLRDFLKGIKKRKGDKVARGKSYVY